jgi:hypothetical protein
MRGEMGAAGPDYQPLRPSGALDADDVQALLRLSHALHAPPADPAVRTRRLIRGLCGLLDADRGISVVTRFDSVTASRTVMSVVQAAAGTDPAAHTRRRGSARGQAGAWHHSPSTDALVAETGIVRDIESVIPLPQQHAFAHLTVGRLPVAGRVKPAAFTAREHAILELVHRESPWLYTPCLPLASSAVLNLLPRRRHVLQYLMAGESDGDVARWLGIPLREVHAEAKAAYRDLGADSREQLLARWAQDTALLHPVPPDKI